MSSSFFVYNSWRLIMSWCRQMQWSTLWTRTHCPSFCHIASHPQTHLHWSAGCRVTWHCRKYSSWATVMNRYILRVLVLLFLRTWAISAYKLGSCVITDVVCVCVCRSNLASWPSTCSACCRRWSGSRRKTSATKCLTRHLRLDVCLLYVTVYTVRITWIDQ